MPIDTKKYWINLFLWTVFTVAAFATVESAAPQENDSQKLADILGKMQSAANSLNTLTADMEYLYVQDPELIDAKTVRKGNIYFKKEENKSNLLISFITRQQDDGEVLKRPEYFLFDGVWLTKVDMKLETIDRYQEAPEGQPVGVFEFISHNFPMVGFTDPNNLEKEFVISIPEKQPTDSTHLHLEVKEDSVYREDYKKLDVWVNNQTWLPSRLTAWSTQGDFYDLRWTEVKINKNLENAVFTIETPAHFRKNTHSIEQETERN